jgi:signal peptidase II
MYYFIIIVLIVIDQAVKYFISVNMDIGDSIPVIENILHITYVYNNGAAFSILKGQTAVLLIIPAILAIAIIAFIYLKRKSGHFTLLFALSLICGGGIGNFLDRARLGAVLDFIDFRVFPIFNVADICVCCGCGLLFLYMVIFDKREKAKSTGTL